MTSTNVTNVHLTPEHQGLFATIILSDDSGNRAGQNESFPRPVGCEPIGTTISLRDEQPAVSVLTESGLVDTLPDSVRDNWNSFNISKLSVGLEQRLRRLASKSDGWRGPGSKKLSSAALRQFLRFWRTIADGSTEPFITLAPNGNLYAEWHVSWKRHLDVEFTGRDKVFFGLIHNNEIIEGTTRTSELINAMYARTKNPFRWKRRNA